MPKALIAVTSSILASDYLGLVSECRTENQVNKLHIKIEKFFAPQEISAIAGTEQLPPMSGRWLNKLAGFNPGIFNSPQQFKRTSLGEQVHLYRDMNQDTAEKSLLVGFCGNGGRLGMPISVFLQYLDSRYWDVAVLQKGPQDKSYLDGLKEISRRFTGVVRYVQAVSGASQYKRVVALGASAGGYPAILAAILMHANRGISICGAAPKAPLGFWLRWKLRNASTRHHPKLQFVHGMDSELDHAAAVSLQNSFGGTLHPRPNLSDHNVLFALLTRGQLAGFLNEVLD